MKSIAIKSLATLAVAGLVLSTFAVAFSAHAATTTTTTTTTTSAAFATDLTLGSKGADVTALQNWLINKGFSIPAGATGYFGAQTKAAVAAYQTSAGITPTAGYFGPKTRAAVNAAGSTTGTTTGTTSDFSGTAEGYLTSKVKLSQYANEKVGEGDTDVKVGGVQYKAQNADQKIERVTVTIDTPTTGSGSTSSTRLEKTVDNVAILLDGKVLGRMDVADATHTSSTNTYEFRFTGLNGIIKKGMKGDITVAVSGASSVTAYKGNGWSVHLDADGVRAVSPNGVSDTYGAASDISTTFTVDTFASSNNVELQASTSGDNLDSTSVAVDSTNDTNDVELLKFTLKAKGSDVNVTEIPVTLTVTGASDVDYVTNKLNLKVNGDTYTETVSTSAATATVTFDNLDLNISEGDSLDFTVTADINNLDSNFTAGNTLTAAVSATNMAYVKATDQTDEDLASSDLTGTASGNAMAFYETGISAQFVSADKSLTVGNSANDDAATFTIKYKVTAFGGDVYVSNSATATTATTIGTPTTGGVSYSVVKGTTATTVGLSATVDVIKDTGTVTNSGVTNGYKITEGSTALVTLTVSRTNTGTAGDAGIYKALLKGIAWATSDTATQNVYSFDLQDYKTDGVTLN